ncbi:MAG: ferrous iron transport protein A, partial [Candidatus Omnitrophica bacterium]|nr:ferrous iron transport protein A [Candidatus Omnitrophota bacterium]
QDRHTMQKLIAIGALPETELTLIQRFPSYVLQIGRTQFCIDRELASSIHVKQG